jgi:hypothetical protein
MHLSASRGSGRWFSSPARGRRGILIVACVNPPHFPHTSSLWQDQDAHAI